MPIFTGQTANEAIQNGLRTLKITRNKANIRIIKDAKKGLLGLNRQEAEVEVTSILPQHTGGAFMHPELLEKVESKDQYDNLGGVIHESVLQDVDAPDLTEHEIAQRHEYNRQKLGMTAEQVGYYLQDILIVMDISVEPQYTIEDHLIKIDLETEDEARLIGHHGKTINALQEMSLVLINQHGIQHVKVVLDTAGYRKKREQVVAKLAKQSATEAIAAGKAVYLDPMPAMERKQIHNELADNQHVRTYSQGQEPNRSIVIAPASEI